MNNEIELKKVYVKPQMSVLEFDQEEPLLCCSADDDDDVGVTFKD